MMLLKFALAAVIVVAVAVSANHIPIHQHSLEPPLLINYEESGMPFWTFGKGTVVANDYVRLTPKGSAGHGYLWNRHPANMLQGQINFTIRASAATGFHLFGGDNSCTTCGTAFWHIQDAARHDRASFFGIPNRFRGVGIVFPTQGNLHLVQSDGQSAVNSLQEVTVGSCAFALDDTPRTVSVTFQNGNFNVVWFQTSRPDYVTPCVANVQPQFVEHRYYFGFTSYFTNPAAVGTDILGMSATGALDPKDDLYAKENFQYDPEDEQKNKKLWDGAADEPKEEEHKKKHAAEGGDAAAVGGVGGGEGNNAEERRPQQAPEEPQF